MTISILLRHGNVQDSYRFSQFWRIIMTMLSRCEVRGDCLMNADCDSSSFGPVSVGASTPSN